MYRYFNLIIIKAWAHGGRQCCGVDDYFLQYCDEKIIKVSFLWWCKCLWCKMFAFPKLQCPVNFKALVFVVFGDIVMWCFRNSFFAVLQC